VLRASFILGIVGAGGVGVQLIDSTESLNYDRVGMILIFIVSIVTLSELISIRARQRAI
jgi:phosphonate transport system permease protein